MRECECECARAGALRVPRGARVSACSRGSSLRPPCPAGRSLPPSPLAPPRRARRWDAPAEQAAAASWGALGSALPEGPLPSSPAPAGPRGARFPRGHALSNFVAAAAASGAGGREGGAPAGPGRAGRGRRGARSAAAPARGPTMPQLGGGGGAGGGGGGGGGSGAGTASGGDDLGANDELIPFQDEGGEEQEPSSDSASAQRDLDEVKSSLVNESENQSSSSDSEVRRRPWPAPGDPSPSPAHPASPLCLFHRRRGARSPPETLSRSRGTTSPKVRVRGTSLHSPAPQRCAPLPWRPAVPRAPVAEPLLSHPLCSSRPGARARGARLPDSLSGSPAAALSPAPGPHPALVLSAVRRPQDGPFFKGPAYPGYPFLMIPDLSSPYLSNGPLSPGGARTVSAGRVAPGRVGAGPGWAGAAGCAPGLGHGVGDGASCADPGQNLFAELNYSGCRA